MNWKVMRSDVNEVEIEFYEGGLLPWDTSLAVKVDVTLTLDEALKFAEEVKVQADRKPV